MYKNRFTPARLMLSSLSAALLAVTLSGCLGGGGGGGGGDDDASAGSPGPQPIDTLQISTSTGEFRGIELNNQRVFRGIPYAKPPVGNLRLAPTEPADKLAGVQQLSDAFANDCPQTSATTGAAAGDEDCLYLNVYAPAAGDDLPVMVWMHGGAFILGSGGGEYDPTRLVDQDVIVVTLNYRLGLLGFLALAGLEHDGGNFGLMDQQEALRWVKNNIASFGGDPDNVTIFGESAGGHSVLSHIVSPRAQNEGLFSKAIIQSGSYAPKQIPKSLANGLAEADTADGGLGFTDTCAGFTRRECINSLSVNDILTIQGGGQSIPTVDPGGDLLPKSIAVALEDGEFDPTLDIMIGSNQDEGTLFVALDELGNLMIPLTDEADFRTRVATLLVPLGFAPLTANNVATHYLSLFPAGPSERLSLALSAIWTDYMFACSSRTHAEHFANAGVDTFNYWFTDEDAPWTMIPPAVPTPTGLTPFSFPFGATHAGEIPYILYPEAIMRSRYAGAEADVDKLAGYMVDYWTNFAKYGDPNSTEGTSPIWPTFNTAEQTLRLDTGEPQAVTAATFTNYHRCSYWDTL